MSQLMGNWRIRLGVLLSWIETIRRKTPHFFLKLFLAFVCVNLVSYWVALLVAFPETALGSHRGHYFKIQFPVAIMGAVFDLLSFQVTIFLVKTALNSASTKVFLSHLLADVGIAAVAMWWAGFVFIVSGTAIMAFERYGQSAVEVTSSHSQSQVSQESTKPGGTKISEARTDASIHTEHGTTESNIDRKTGYAGKILGAVQNPLGNLRSIGFVAIMGISATLPTFVHLFIFVMALFGPGEKTGWNPLTDKTVEEVVQENISLKKILANQSIELERLKEERS